MKRVVVTGLGIVSCLGNDKASVLDSLQQGRSGIRFKDDYKQLGLRSHVAGSIDIPSAIEFAGEQSYPIIVKPDMGGRGKNVQRVTNAAGLVSALEEGLADDQYRAPYIVQEFIPSVRPIDCRIAIVDGQLAFSYSRTLTSRNGEAPWLASTTNGSQEGPYSPKSNEIAVAIQSSAAIGALFNEMDVCFSAEGPVIIENNPTPNYIEGDSDDLQRLTTAVDLIMQKYDMSSSPHPR